MGCLLSGYLIFLTQMIEVVSYPVSRSFWTLCATDHRNEWAPGLLIRLWLYLLVVAASFSSKES